MPQWIWPVQGTNRSNINRKDKPGEGAGEFGPNRNGGTKYHWGIDIQAADGTPVVAVADATVVRVVPLEGNPKKNKFGVQLVLKHKDNVGNNIIFTQYAHMLAGSLVLRVGNAVTAGQKVGLVGRTGNTPSQGDSHLHFEVRLNSMNAHRTGGNPVNPLSSGYLG